MGIGDSKRKNWKLFLFFFYICKGENKPPHKHSWLCVYFTELRLKDVNSSVLKEVVFCLNNQSPLGNNWKAIAAEMGLNLPHIQSLDYHGHNGMMRGVLDIMFHKKMTVGDLVKMLHNIGRPDVIEVFTKAGFQDTFVHEKETGMVQYWSIILFSLLGHRV